MLEITDVIVDYDPGDLSRRPVRRADALERLRSSGAPRRALRLVERIPAPDGVLDPAAVDAVIVRSHGELQRLWEEFLHGRRVADLLGALSRALAAVRGEGSRRFVDIGCGPGFVVRWLTAHEALPGIRLLGTDLNPALIDLASRLAAAEALDCGFVVANAFELEEPADAFFSTGVIHHFRGDDLRAFFAQQAAGGPAGFIHFDVQRSWAAPLGSWLFHKARMREPVAQVDGTISAIRAHPTEALLQAAAEGAPGYRIGHWNRSIPALPMFRTMHAVVGLQDDLVDPFVRELGAGARVMGAFA